MTAQFTEVLDLELYVAADVIAMAGWSWRLLEHLFAAQAASVETLQDGAKFRGCPTIEVVKPLPGVTGFVVVEHLCGEAESCLAG